MVFRTLLPGANTYSLYGLFEYGDYAEAAELALNIARRSPESTRDTAYLAAVALEFAGDADAAALQYAALAADDAAFPYNLLAAIHLKD